MGAPGVWRGFHAGTRQGTPDDPGFYPEYGPDLFALGPWPTTAAPWFDEDENPFASGLPLDLVSQPSMSEPDIGALPIVGAYMAQDIGPVAAFSREDQNSGRVMRFATNPIMRVDEFGGGVMDGPSYADELAAQIAANGQGLISDNQVTTDLLLYR